MEHRSAEHARALERLRELEGAAQVDRSLGLGAALRRRIEGELSDLIAGRVNGRAGTEEITLFKSVGSAIEDMAAARLVISGSTAGN